MRGRKARSRFGETEGPGAQDGPGGRIGHIDGLNLDFFVSDSAQPPPAMSSDPPHHHQRLASPSTDNWMANLVDGPDAARRARYRARLASRATTAPANENQTSEKPKGTSIDPSAPQLRTGAGYRHGVHTSSGYRPGKLVWSGVTVGDPQRFEERRQLDRQNPPLSPMGKIHRAYAMHRRHVPSGRWPFAVPGVLQPAASSPALCRSISRSLVGGSPIGAAGKLVAVRESPSSSLPSMQARCPSRIARASMASSPWPQVPSNSPAAAHTGLGPGLDDPPGTPARTSSPWPQTPWSSPSLLADSPTLRHTPRPLNTSISVPSLGRAHAEHAAHVAHVGPLPSLGPGPHVPSRGRLRLKPLVSKVRHDWPLRF